jgi:hypothetical protein
MARRLRVVEPLWSPVHRVRDVLLAQTPAPWRERGSVGSVLSIGCGQGEKELLLANMLKGRLSVSSFFLADPVALSMQQALEDAFVEAGSKLVFKQARAEQLKLQQSQTTGGRSAQTTFLASLWFNSLHRLEPQRLWQVFQSLAWASSTFTFVVGDVKNPMYQVILEQLDGWKGFQEFVHKGVLSVSQELVPTTYDMTGLDEEAVLGFARQLAPEMQRDWKDAIMQQFHTQKRLDGPLHINVCTDHLLAFTNMESLCS